MSSDVKIVDRIAKYIVKHKGKQFRPALVILSAKAVGQPQSNTYITAAVVELLHTATLVHDDVIDDSELRRGFPTIHKVWKNKIAILMGDYLLAKSLIAATEAGSLRIMNTVATVAKRLIKGEMFEIQKSRNLNLTEEEYFKLVGDKTASLISACCELGAVTVNATPEQQEALRKYGEYVGIAFQIKDDLLDYESSSKILGKPAAADIQEKKITLPLIYAFEGTSDGERRRVIKLMKNGAKRKDIRFILDFVNNHQGLKRANQTALLFRDRAIEQTNLLPPSEARNALQALATFVIARTK
ncbi:MAG: polyprenyl synthetase family protein, partial [Calditrichia bacterium]